MKLINQGPQRSRHWQTQWWFLSLILLCPAFHTAAYSLLLLTLGSLGFSFSSNLTGCCFMVSVTTDIAYFCVCPFSQVVSCISVVLPSTVTQVTMMKILTHVLSLFALIITFACVSSLSPHNSPLLWSRYCYSHFTHSPVFIATKRRPGPVLGSQSVCRPPPCVPLCWLSDVLSLALPSALTFRCRHTTDLVSHIQTV